MLWWDLKRAVNLNKLKLKEEWSKTALAHKVDEFGALKERQKMWQKY